MGRVLVEAMATGKAVVASNVGGIPDLVKHGQNGFLIKPGDIYALSFYIEKLLGDETLRSDMGEIGQTMSRNFSVKKMVDRIDRLYISFLQNR
jgi:glycosyltransferase involved in cell wall biosynthesis